MISVLNATERGRKEENQKQNSCQY